MKLYKDIEGWCPDEKTRLLQELVKSTDAQVIVELGVYGGKSLIPMAITCKEKGSGICYGIDPWLSEASVEGWEDGNTNKEWWGKLDHSMIYNRWREALEKYDVHEYVEELRGYADEYTEMFEDESIDIFHLDGNHSEETSCRDVANWLPKLKFGGFFVFDDTNWPSTERAQKMVDDWQHDNRFCEVYHEGDGWRVYQKLLDLHN